MRRAEAARPAAILVLCGALAGCGYALVGRGSVLPPGIKTIAVSPFENRTRRPEIEQRVTEEVTAAFAKRGGYRVVSDPKRADAVLDGAIVGFETNPVQFNAAGRATRVETVVTLQATLRETATDRILWSQTQLLFREQYDVPETGEFFDQETLALDDIARGAAGTLVTSILEGF